MVVQTLELVLGFENTLLLTCKDIIESSKLMLKQNYSLIHFIIQCKNMSFLLLKF